MENMIRALILPPSYLNLPPKSSFGKRFSNVERNADCNMTLIKRISLTPR